MIKSKRNLAILLIGFILIIGLLSAVLAIAWYNDAVYNPPSTNQDLIDFQVEAGSNLLDITPRLQEQGIIKSAEVLRIYLRLNNVSFTLVKGKYLLTAALNVPDLLARLAKGPTAFSVTIPEALRADEIVDIITNIYALESIQLNKQLMLDIIASPDNQAFSAQNKEFLAAYKPAGKSLEGFLFPDTYILGADAAELQIIDLLITNLRTRVAEAGIDPASATRAGSFYEVLTLASIVEREARTFEDMQLVADIFLRRTEQGWTLGADAPLLYPFQDWGHALTSKELADSSNPYNVRVRTGLPPTPICNPGIAGIKAVINPVVNDYMYFISDASGNNYYARTLSEHNQNVANYL